MSKITVKAVLLPAFFYFFFFGTSSAQIFICDPSHSYPTTPPCTNPIVTAVPFLRIVPDARSAGMGDAGITTSTDANALHFNSSKLAFTEDQFGFSATYTPWLRALGLQDVHLLYFTGYAQVDAKQTVGAGLRYFTLGTTSDTGEMYTFSPHEYELAVSYNRQLSEKFAVGLTVKYIYSKIGMNDNGQVYTPFEAETIAGDLSFTYKTSLTDKLDLTIGSVISNLGSKVQYRDEDPEDFLPANLGIGTGLSWRINELHSIHFALDINRLLAPTPPLDDAFNQQNNNSGSPFIPDYLEQSTLKAALNSFSDSQVGFYEEIIENNYSFGAEYCYKRFAVRIGHFNEHWVKGNRKYMTYGLGFNSGSATLNVSYLHTTTKGRHSLDNTMRLSLMVDFGEAS